MSKYTLTAREVAEVAGVSFVTVNNYVNNGYVTPVKEYTAMSKGNGREFSASQAIAICYAQQWREYGLSGPAIDQVMNSISTMTLEKIEQNIERGWNVVFPEHRTQDERRRGPWWFSPGLADGNPTITKVEKITFNILNIEHAYSKVMLAIGRKYPELTANPEKAPVTNEDKIVKFLKSARQEAARQFNAKKRGNR